MLQSFLPFFSDPLLVVDFVHNEKLWVRNCRSNSTDMSRVTERMYLTTSLGLWVFLLMHLRQIGLQLQWVSTALFIYKPAFPQWWLAVQYVSHLPRIIYSLQPLPYLGPAKPTFFHFQVSGSSSMVQRNTSGWAPSLYIFCLSEVLTFRFGYHNIWPRDFLSGQLFGKAII